MEKVGGAGTVAATKARDKGRPQCFREPALQVFPRYRREDGPEPEGGGEEQVIDMPPGGPVPVPVDTEVPLHPCQPARAEGGSHVQVPPPAEPEGAQGTHRQLCGAVLQQQAVDPPIHGTSRGTPVQR